MMNMNTGLADQYADLEREHTATPKRLVDHSVAWAKLPPLAEVNGNARELVVAFCRSKRIGIEALVALGTRVHIDGNGGIELAWGYEHRGAITAVKFRPIGDRPPYTLKPSSYLKPLVIGNRESLDWFIAEGETDTARLYGFVGTEAAILCLPAGAGTFKHEWGDVIPRGATVYTALDADVYGDDGAKRASRELGGGVRVRPPDGFKDWCEWDGGRDDFIELVRVARGGQAQFQVVTLDEFAAVDEPGAEALVGSSSETAVIPEGGDCMYYGDGGAGKTTLALDLVFHLAAGDPWLGIPIARAVTVLVIENEGPRPHFRKKLGRKRDGWAGSPTGDRIRVLEEPWSEITLLDETHRQALAKKILEVDADVVVIGPVTAAGMLEAGTIQQVREFMANVGDVRRRTGRIITFILIHHENKGGSVSGAWEGVGDTLFHVQAQGHGRTRLFIQKARWSSVHHATALQLIWAPGDGFEVSDEQERDDDTLADEILQAVRQNGGTPWTPIEKQISGKGARLRAIRDRLIAGGLIFNAGTETRTKLWHADDPALPTPPSQPENSLQIGQIIPLLPSRPGWDDSGTTQSSAPGNENTGRSRPSSQPYRDEGRDDSLDSPVTLDKTAGNR
jgi:hypothetical protein